MNTSRFRVKEVILKTRQTIIGYDEYKDRFYTIDSDRIHTLLLGETGAGKSEMLKLLIYHNILRGEGFMLIDPHGSLAKDVYSMLKEEGLDAIYLDMNTNHKINPIGESNIHLLSFISVLKNLYDYAWGDRLETILRNVLLLIEESDPPCTLSKIARVLANKEYREMLVKGSGNTDMNNFWFRIYPSYAYDAFTAVYNKIDKLLSISKIRKIFDVESSNIEIDDIVKEKKIIIIDLSSIIDDDIIRFVGSIFIHMLYVSAKSKSALENKYYLYIDEAQLINTFAIREVLNAMRKFNVNVTLVTQSINRFDISIRKELTSLCRTLILFRVDKDTAKELCYLFNVIEERIYNLPLHYFYFYQQGEKAIRGLAKSYPI